MSSISIYLNEHKINCDSFFSQIGYTESQLSNLSVITYDDEVIAQLAQAMNKSKSTVWVELLSIESHTSIITVNSDEGLKEALENKVAMMYIPPEYKEKQSKLLGSVLTEKDLLGLELGSQGRIHIADSVINWVFNLFTSESKEYKWMENKLRSYRLKANDKNGLVLFRQENSYY